MTPSSRAVEALADLAYQFAFHPVETFIVGRHNQDVLVAPAALLHRLEVRGLGLDAGQGAAIGGPTNAGVEWLALEDRFRLHGDFISFLGAPGASVARRKNDPAAPVHGPFSADFRLVYLDGEDSPPIRCTPGQAEVFRALWEFAGQDRRAEDVMRRTGRSSPKPIDLFKAHPERKRAYETLVVTNQKEGLYRMPCAVR